MTPEQIAAYDTFNTDLAKRLQGLKRDANAESIRQGYKGTGSAKHRRQLWVRFKSGAVLDLWIDTGYLLLGGVVCNAPPGSEATSIYRAQIAYTDRTPAEVYEQARAILNVWANPTP